MTKKTHQPNMFLFSTPIFNFQIIFFSFFFSAKKNTKQNKKDCRRWLGHHIETPNVIVISIIFFLAKKKKADKQSQGRGSEKERFSYHTSPKPNPWYANAISFPTGLVLATTVGRKRLNSKRGEESSDSRTVGLSKVLCCVEGRLRGLGWGGQRRDGGGGEVRGRSGTRSGGGRRPSSRSRARDGSRRCGGRRPMAGRMIEETAERGGER